jgi:hypothetical protein
MTAATPSALTLASLRMRFSHRPFLTQVEIQMAQGGEELDDACLRRWLRADKWNVAAAEARLRTHAKWRVSVAPSGAIDQALLLLLF